MTKTQIIQAIEEILRYDFDRPDVVITKTTTIEDLYISSLELADLILKIEETLDIETPFGNGVFPFAYIDEFIDWLVEKTDQ